MGFPRTYAAIMEMVPAVALQTEVARGVARKAGLRRGSGSVITAAVSDFVGSAEQPLARQWLVDFTGLGRGYFYSNASSPLYIFRSANLLSSALDPGDYEPLMDSTFTQFSSAAPEWRDIYSPHLSAQRLTISTSSAGVEMDEGLLSGAFNVLFQAV